MSRRGFLGSCLALSIAPAIVKAGSLMRIAQSTDGVILPLGLAGVVREIRAYDLPSDTFLIRWDVAGKVNGFLTQFHVGAIENNDPRPIVAVEGRHIFVSGAPAGMEHLFGTREVALAALRQKIAATGMQIERGVLELPEGVGHARFLE